MDTYEHLHVGAADLVEALTSGMSEASWLLDLESGEVVFAGQEDGSEEPEDEEWEDPARFLVIEPMDSHHGFGLMEAFAEQLPEGEARRALARALRLPKPFRSFKDTLADFPDERERWFKFHQDRMLEYAQDWLDDNLPGARLILA